MDLQHDSKILWKWGNVISWMLQGVNT
jgi:hypothetical protein